MAKAEELEMDDEDEEDDEDEKRERLKEKAGVSLAKKAKASGIPAGILRQVYNRGVISRNARIQVGHKSTAVGECLGKQFYFKIEEHLGWCR